MKKLQNGRELFDSVRFTYLHAFSGELCDILYYTYIFIIKHLTDWNYHSLKEKNDCCYHNLPIIYSHFQNYEFIIILIMQIYLINYTSNITSQSLRIKSVGQGNEWNYTCLKGILKRNSNSDEVTRGRATHRHVFIYYHIDISRNLWYT